MRVAATDVCEGTTVIHARVAKGLAVETPTREWHERTYGKAFVTHVDMVGRVEIFWTGPRTRRVQEEAIQ